MPIEGTGNATRESLLDAAKRVVQHVGAGNLTLDAVAKEAGVSKGGLLYHFPSKQALLRGMVAKGIGHAEEELSEQLGAHPNRGKFAQCFLSQAMFGPKECAHKPPAEAVWSMLGAAANDPSLLEPVREMHAHWQNRLEEDLGDPDVATLFRLVAHGMFSTELFGFSVPDRAQRERIVALLSKVAGLDTESPIGDVQREKEERG
ncbi:TetR/AcrR family transcriptional regulator [bacterium]|nr:MAG: TetR/AcrR family transcriptional regulator [bacterium]